MVIMGKTYVIFKNNDELLLFSRGIHLNFGFTKNNATSQPVSTWYWDLKMRSSGGTIIEFRAETQFF